MAKTQFQEDEPAPRHSSDHGTPGIVTALAQLVEIIMAQQRRIEAVEERLGVIETSGRRRRGRRDP